MKALLTFLLGMACLTVRAAVGTGGGGAASGASSLGASNLLSTNCIVTANGDTNRLIVSGMGGGTNGTYVFNNTSPGVWTSAVSRTVAIYHDGSDAFLTNAGGQLNSFGLAPNPPIGSWDAAGTTAYDSATNCYSYAFSLTPATNVIYINCGDTNFLQKISNCPNNTIIFVGPCSTGYVYASWAWSTNAVAVPLALVNKTNVTIQGYGMPSFNSAQTPFADGMHISNCSRITLRGIRLENVRYTNIVAMPNFFDSKQAGALRLFASEHVLVEGCEVVNWWNHGIFDTATVTGTMTPTTNNLVIRFNRFVNGGSYHPTADAYDGAAVVTCGGWIYENDISEWAHGIELYSITARIYNARVMNNRLRNIIGMGIWNSSSTNLFDTLVDGNSVEYDIGYTRGGTNFYATSAAFNFNAGAGLVMRNNRTVNALAGAYFYGGAAPTLGDVVMENNTFINTTNHAPGTGNPTVLFGGTAAQQKITVRNNEVRLSAYDAIRLQGVNNAILEGNRIVDANTLSTAGRPAVWIGAFDVACSNILARGNVIIDQFATARSAYGISVGDSTGAGVKRVQLIGNDIRGVGTALILNTAGAECFVDGTWPLGTTNVAALVSGRYTNNVWDRVVGIPGATTTIGRTNLLPNAALSNYFTAAITIWDKGTNASGTNVWIATVASQTINGGPTITNITTDNGSLTLQPDGNGNWRIVGAYP